MERLTYKNYIEEYEVNFEKNSEKQWSIAESDTHIKVTGQPIDKLADFEDFMEEQGFESLEQLKDFMQDTKNAMLDVLKVADRWQKLKEWVEKKYADNYIDANDTKSPLTTQEYYGGSADSCRKTLDKMKELEKEIK